MKSEGSGRAGLFLLATTDEFKIRCRLLLVSRLFSWDGVLLCGTLSMSNSDPDIKSA